MPERYRAALDARYVKETANRGMGEDPVTVLLARTDSIRFMGIFSQAEAPRETAEAALKSDATTLGIPAHKQRIEYVYNEGEFARVKTSLLRTHVNSEHLDDLAPKKTDSGYEPVAGRKLIYCAPSTLDINRLAEDSEEFKDFQMLLPTLILVITNPRLTHNEPELPVGKLIVGSTQPETREVLHDALTS